MSQLLTLKGPQPGQIYVIAQKISIGNLPNSNICLTSKTPKANIEIDIQQTGDRYRLIKKQGLMPVLINGKDVQEATLLHGDIIGIDECVFLFNRGTDAEATASGNNFLDALKLLPHEEDEQNEWAIFYHIASLVSNIVDLPTLLKHLTEFLLETFHSTTAFVFLKDSDQMLLRLASWKSQLPLKDLQPVKAAISHKIVNLVAKHKKGISYRFDAKSHCFYVMAVPLIYQSDVIGMIVLEAPQKSQIFVQEDVKDPIKLHDLYLLAGIALLAANGIANVQRYFERKKHIHRLESLNKITLRLSSFLDLQSLYKETAQEVCKLLQCSKCAILYREHNQLKVGSGIGLQEDIKKKVIPSDQGPLAWVLLHGKSLMVAEIPNLFVTPDTQKHAFCMIVPVIVRQTAIAKIAGLICVADPINLSAFTKQDKELLALIANQVGIALVNASLYEQATVDFLTKIYVRGFFFEKLDEMVLDSQENKASLSLLMLDIDFFKRLNDAHGHQVGDSVLQDLGTIIKRYTREDDIAGRYGGEEFIIALKNTNFKHAIMIAERIRNTVANMCFRYKELALQLTVSIGLAEYVMEEPVEKWVARCDSALYMAKNSGRNKVC